VEVLDALMSRRRTEQLDRHGELRKLQRDVAGKVGAGGFASMNTAGAIAFPPSLGPLSLSFHVVTGWLVPQTDRIDPFVQD
jgi:hypothetical protein